MATRFELVSEQDKVCFQMRGADGQVLLHGVGGGGKITVQNEILHLRRALQAPAHLIPHQTRDGAHFFVVKEDGGNVLARSAPVPTPARLAELANAIVAGAKAPIVDLTRHPRAATG